MKRLLLLTLFLCATLISGAKVKLPAVLGSGMVLQRNTQTAIWGWAEAGKPVSVLCSWSGKTYKTTADKSGNWIVKVATPEAGGPYSITIADTEKTVLNDILIGEVWVCSGQSNMEMPMKGFGGQHIENSTKTIINASQYKDKIRLFTVKKETSDTPKTDCIGEWKLASPESVADFSAVGWFYGQTLSDAINIPIGLISTNWGGTPIETWTSIEYRDEMIAKGLELEKNRNKRIQDTDAALYNAMIAPITNFAARGFIWYQGEANIKTLRIYDKQMAGMVACWRDAWKNQDMPFYFVEIAPYNYKNPNNPNNIDKSLLVESQHRALDIIPQSGIACTIDLGDDVTIHPPYKQEVAMRLALHALYNDYGINAINPLNPRYQSAVYKDGKAIVDFKNPASGFIQQSDLVGFELAGEDMVFYPAKAKVIYTKNQVEIVCDKVAEPVAVRYGFRNTASGNLYSISGIPALPFRTDNWPSSSTR